jgi:ABC-type polysaccharide/polyol phosphate export permease
MHKTRKIRKWRIYQILMGIVLLILCGIIVAMANTGLTAEDRDITPVLLFGPLGLYLIFTKKKIIY